MSGTIISLYCWVIGTPATKIFTIKIEYDETWGNVKDAIKEEEKNDFADIDADTLDLWKVRQCVISHIVAQIPIQKVTIDRSRLESEDFWKSVMVTNFTP